MAEHDRVRLHAGLTTASSTQDSDTASLPLTFKELKSTGTVYAVSDETYLRRADFPCPLGRCKRLSCTAGREMSERVSRFRPAGDRPHYIDFGSAAGATAAASGDAHLAIVSAATLISYFDVLDQSYWRNLVFLSSVIRQVDLTRGFPWRRFRQLLKDPNRGWVLFQDDLHADLAVHARAASRVSHAAAPDLDLLESPNSSSSSLFPSSGAPAQLGHGASASDFLIPAGAGSCGPYRGALAAAVWLSCHLNMPLDQPEAQTAALVALRPRGAASSPLGDGRRASAAGSFAAAAAAGGGGSSGTTGEEDTAAGLLAALRVSSPLPIVVIDARLARLAERAPSSKPEEGAGSRTLRWLARSTQMSFLDMCTYLSSSHPLSFVLSLSFSCLTVHSLIHSPLPASITRSHVRADLSRPRRECPPHASLCPRGRCPRPRRRRLDRLFLRLRLCCCGACPRARSCRSHGAAACRHRGWPARAERQQA